MAMRGAKRLISIMNKEDNASIFMDKLPMSSLDGMVNEIGVGDRRVFTAGIILNILAKHTEKIVIIGLFFIIKVKKDAMNKRVMENSINIFYFLCKAKD
jgi:hypothetical protein